MKIEIQNQQKIKKISLKNISRYIRKIGKILGISSKSISFVLCDNSFIRKVNKKFLNRNRPTDVIAFCLCDEFDKNYLGEVIVSVQEAINSSKKYKNSWQEELLLYIVHGILHLLGYKDYSFSERKKMQEKQQKILEILKHSKIKF